MARAMRRSLTVAALAGALTFAGFLPAGAHAQAPRGVRQPGMLAVVDGQASTGNYGAPLIAGCQWATWVANCSNLTVYGNGSSFNDSGCGAPNGCTFGPEFQCTELAQRYAYYAWGEPATWNGYGGADGSAAQMWNAGPYLPVPLLQFAQGGAVAPQQGDLLIFSPGWLGSYWDGNGHVAVVTAVGSGFVDIAEENGTAGGSDQLGLSGTVVIANGYTPVLGWLHNPLISVTGMDKISAASSGSTQILFWQGADDHLREAWISGGVWSGPSDLTAMWNGAALLTSAPAAVFSTTGLQTVYWRGSGGHLWQSTYVGDTWAAPVDLSATWTSDQMLLSAPAAMVNSSGQQIVFWQGATGALWETWSSGTTWIGPGITSAAWTGFVPLASAPAVAMSPAGAQVVYWQAINGDLLEAWYVGGWNGPVDLTTVWHGQGKVGSSPSIAFAADGSEGVFWKGADNHLWEAWFNGAWNGPVDWDSLGSIRSAPAVTSVAGGRQSAYWQNAAGDLSLAVWVGGWNGPVDQSTTWRTGLLASAPSEASTPDGKAQLTFWRANDGHLWETWYTNQWYGPVDWTSQWHGSGLLASAPSVAITPDGLTQMVFWEGTNGHLWEAWFNGSWNGPADWGPTFPGALLGSAPSVAVTPTGQQCVFWRGPNGHLEEVWFNGRWNGPADWSAQWPAAPLLASAPTVGVTADGSAQVVLWQDPSGHLLEAWYTGSWNGPVDRSAAWSAAAMLGSSPSLVMAPGGEQLVFWQGVNGHLWETWWGGQWSAPVDWASAGYLSGQVGSAPSADVVNGQQAVFWKGPTGHLVEAWWGGAWTAPADISAIGPLT